MPRTVLNPVLPRALSARTAPRVSYVRSFHFIMLILLQWDISPKIVRIVNQKYAETAGMYLNAIYLHLANPITVRKAIVVVTALNLAR